MYYGTWPNPKFPEDWKDWENYVRTIVAHHYPRIRDWAVWNEPNHPVFLKYDRSKPGDWQQKYVTILKHTYGVVKSVSPDVQVIGGTVTHPAALTELVDSEAMKYMDVAAFHWAAWTPKGYVRNTGEERGLLDPKKRDENCYELCRDAMKRAGKTVPMWDTECHMTQAEIEREFVTHPAAPRKQATPLVTRIEAANAVVRQTVVEWAGGVDKTFYWRLGASGSVRADCTMLEYDRSPGAAVVSYAVMTWMLEDAEFIKCQSREIQSGIEKTTLWVFEFRKANKRIRVIWGTGDMKQQVRLPVLGQSATVRDMFGVICPGAASMSAVPLDGEVLLHVGRSPFYVVDAVLR